MMRRRPHPGSPLGFTLIEILVALAIFAVIALLCYRTLSSLFDVRERLQQESARWRDVALLFARMDSDFTGLLDRKTVNADGLLIPALTLTQVAPGTDDAQLSFSRTGFADSDGLAGPPQRTGYRLREGRVEWLLWPGLDQAPRTAPNTYTALSGVQSAVWQALDRDGTQRDAWPPPGQDKPSFPAALKFTLTLNGGEQVSRVFALRHD